MHRYDLIQGYAERGALMYRQWGTPEAARMLLKKSAKILESSTEGNYSEGAVSLYYKASETVLCEDRPREASEYLIKAARLQVRNNLRFCNSI